MLTVAAIAIGFLLDSILGDPRRLPHPVIGMGKTIVWAEKVLRGRFPDTPAGQRNAGIVLAIALPLATFILACLVLYLAGLISYWLAFALNCIMSYQVIAACELRKQSMFVMRELYEKGLDAGRSAVSRIVGRDTDALDEAGVIRATVETVAENSSDGVVAPFMFLMIGGGPLGLVYKAVNTLDSMVGYKNDIYRYFGTASAKLDDVANWIPSRINALAMVLCAWMVGLNSSHAWKIWRRDGRNHASPNSAQTEAACAGALGVQLAGNAVYFGKLVEKPTIGDPLRPIEPADVMRANKLMLASSVLCFLIFALIRIGLCVALDSFGIVGAMGS